MRINGLNTLKRPCSSALIGEADARPAKKKDGRRCELRRWGFCERRKLEALRFFSIMTKQL